MSQLTFDPKLGLVAPETESIREAVQSDWQGAFRDVDVELNVEPSTPAGQLVDAETAEIEAKNAELLFLSNMFNPKVSEGRWQDALGYIYFLTRKIAQPTVVECSVTGLMGTTIPYGAMAQSTDGYYLLNTGAFTIPESGTATGYFRLAEPGPIPIAAGSVTKIVTLIPGWSSIVNKSAGVVGRDVETRAEFESRRYASVAKNATGPRRRFTVLLRISTASSTAGCSKTSPMWKWSNTALRWRAIPSPRASTAGTTPPLRKSFSGRRMQAAARAETPRLPTRIRNAPTPTAGRSTTTKSCARPSKRSGYRSISSASPSWRRRRWRPSDRQSWTTSSASPKHRQRPRGAGADRVCQPVLYVGHGGGRHHLPKERQNPARRVS